jgi:HEAT repeat protein
MANDQVERKLDRLKALRVSGKSDIAVQELRKSLHDKVNVVVAKSADMVGEWQAMTLLPDLLDAFSRLLDHPEADQQCWGKNALSKSIKNLGYSESALFLRGLKHRQYEAVWGGKVDTAGMLRATCAFAIVQCTDIPRHTILVHLVDALGDPDARVRADALRALEQTGGRDVELLLRLKAHAGDTEIRVTGQVFECLLQMEGDSAVPFVAEFFKHSNEEVSDEAALALGASRLQVAVDLLIQKWVESKVKHTQSILLRAISVSRLDSAFDFLIEQIRTSRTAIAEDALRALELHKDSEEIVKRVEDAVLTRDELQALFEKEFKS